MKFHFDDRKWFAQLKLLEAERKLLLTLGIAFGPPRKAPRKFPLLIPVPSVPTLSFID